MPGRIIDPDAALAAARAFDKSGRRGPLAGVPFGVKDIIDTFDMPTEWGTPIHKGRQPERDAACVALSRKAGGMLLGKTVTTEFANLHPGPTRNPHDLTRTPGRLVERLGRGGRRLHGADRDRHPDHRLDHPAGVVLRRVRLSPDLWRAPHARRHGSLGLARHARHPGALGRRHRALSRRAARHSARADADDRRAPHIALCRSHVWDQFEPATRDADRGRRASRLARAGARVTRVHPARRVRAAQRRAPLDLELRVRPHLHLRDREPLGRDQRHAARRPAARRHHRQLRALHRGKAARRRMPRRGSTR